MFGIIELSSYVFALGCSQWQLVRYETKRKWKRKEYDILKKINKMHFQSEFNETIQTQV